MILFQLSLRLEHGGRIKWTEDNNFLTEGLLVGDKHRGFILSRGATSKPFRS